MASLYQKNIRTMLKRLSSILFLLVPAFCLAACGGDDDADDNGGSDTNTISVNTKSLSFDGNAGSQTVTLTTNHEWAATTSADWISVDPKNSTSHSATITISVKKNSDFEGREGSVTIMAGSARETITVTQAGGDGVPDPNEITCPIKGYTLVWNDEFDKGTTPDLDKWTFQVASPGWVNNELQTYVNGATPDGTKVADIKDGKLRIKCFKENGKIYSARMYGNVKTGWTYGYIEASIKLPKGKGTWPAFWMMPVNFRSWPADGEIDIMEEVGYHPDYVSSSLHANAHVHSNGTQVTHEMHCPGAEGEFHTYAIEWTAKNITTYVDGKVQLSYDNRGLGRDDWPYDDPFYVILNLAWGGSWGGAQGVNEAALPVTMEVDYVRVFQKK